MLMCTLIFVWKILNGVQCGPWDRYKGHKVVQMVAGTESKGKLLEEYVSNHSKVMNVWSQTPLACQVDIRVADMDRVQKFCQQNQMKLKVMIKDLEKAIKDHIKNDTAFSTNLVAKNPHHRIANQEAVFNYAQYNRYEDILKEVYRLQCKHPNLIDVSYVGRSFENRPLILVQISENIFSSCTQNKKIIWIDGGTHAREWISVATPMFILRELVEGYGKNATIRKLLQQNAVFIAPVINPDGYEYTFTEDRLWRKTTTRTVSTECIGIDANRNWDSMFQDGAGGSSDPCSDLYRGEFPEQEPVVKAYANILRYIKKRIKTYWTLHSFAQFLLIPNSYTDTPPADLKQLIKPSLEFLTVMRIQHGKLYGTGIAKEFQGRLLTGVSMDYVHDALNVTFSYLLELSPSTNNPIGFLLPASQIVPVSTGVWWSFLKSLEKIDALLKQG